MRNIQIFLLLFLFVGSIFTSCSLDEDPIQVVEQTVFNVSEDFGEWLLPFDSIGRMIQYNNSEDSIVFVTVERTFNRISQDYIDCEIDNRQVQCEFKSINIAFPEDIHPNNFQAFISIFSIAPNDLRVMANRTGFLASVARFNGDPEDIASEIPDHYSASYQSNFVHNGITRPAIIIETITLDNIPAGAIIAPKRMILVKEFGMVEWEDYNGNIWILQD